MGSVQKNQANDPKMESRSQESTSCSFLRPAFHSQLQLDDLLIQRQPEAGAPRASAILFPHKLYSKPNKYICRQP